MAPIKALVLATLLTVLATAQGTRDYVFWPSARHGRPTKPKIIEEFNQCGGKGGDCKDFGGCDKDAPFASYKCAKGLECKRHDEWYWQCLKDHPTPTPTPTPTPKPSSKTIDEHKQCGGKGGDCADFGDCKDDAPFAGYKCAKGLKCNRHNEWYWQCQKGDSTTPEPKPSPKPSSKTIHEHNQCGGKGGDCKDFGGCKDDAPFDGYKCAKGLMCKRQNEWYWQCQKGADTTPEPKPSPKPSSKVIDEHKQCGGKGGDCADFGDCKDDAPFAGYKCAKGLKCNRQNEWYWQCQKGDYTTHEPKPSPKPSSKTIQEFNQCGGKGGDCKDFGDCMDDAPFAGYKCAKGLKCIRHNEWYWQCL